MSDSTDIHKAGGILIQNRKMLAELSYGKDHFIFPGGKIEAGETPEQSLIRELKEEFNIDVNQADLEFFGKYSDEAANHPGRTVHMDLFVVKAWRGEPTPGHEVCEMRWFDSHISPDIKVGSIFAQKVMPELKRRGLVD